MSKLVMWNLVSLDGMFEGSQPWDLKHAEYVWGLQILESRPLGDRCLLLRYKAAYAQAD